MACVLSKLTGLALVALLSSPAIGHTWNEQLVVIGDNGSFTGAYGYPRGYIARTDPGFDGESDKYQLPSLESGRTSVNTSDLLCHPAQRVQNQTAKYPRLQAAPGSWVAFRQLENGHVTLPQNQAGKPDNRGTVYVYATMQPKNDETLVDVISWNTAGTGGDKRGRLIAMNDFDDLRCHQMNSGSISAQRQAQFPDPVPGQPGTKTELWCETDVKIPEDTSFVQPGKPLTVYWIWDWPYLPGSPGLADGKQEWYTTCSDIDIVASPPSGPLANKLDQQDPMASAVSGYMSRSAKYTVPSYFTWTVSGSKPPPAPTNAAIALGPGGAASPSPAAPTASTATPSISPSTLPSTQSPVVATPAAPASPSGTAQGSVLTALITVVATLAPGQSVVTVSGTHVVAFTAQASDSSSPPPSSSFAMTTVTIPAPAAATPVSPQVSHSSSTSAAPADTPTASPLGLSGIQIPQTALQGSGAAGGDAGPLTTVTIVPSFRRRGVRFARAR